MKTLKTSLFISLALCMQTIVNAQPATVGDWPNTTTPVVGDWPASSSFTFFGTNTLSQSSVVNYALLQSKIAGGVDPAGTTFLNSPASIYFRINNSTQMTLANSGYFGIGTTVAPRALLDVNGPALFANSVITIGGTTGTSYTERVYLNYDGSTALARLNGRANVGLSFGVSDANDALIVKPGGGVGIGIGNTIPVAQLEVKNAASFYLQLITMGPSTGLNSERVYLTYDPSAALARLNGRSGVGLSFGVSDANDAFVIKPGGGVGIGIGNVVPVAQLEVKNAASFYQQLITMGPSTGLASERVYLTYDPSTAFARLNGRSGVMLSFGTNGANDALMINSAGNVGIGTTTVGLNQNLYKLAVKGTIGAQAVKVEVSSQEWSDYVFEKNYTLKTIPELEAFINTNKHLPNVPSACEVEEKGIDMATMDATLLAKIEELSLYIIEQNKKLEAQSTKLEAQNKRFEALEELVNSKK